MTIRGSEPQPERLRAEGTVAAALTDRAREREARAHVNRRTKGALKALAFESDSGLMPLFEASPGAACRPTPPQSTRPGLLVVVLAAVCLAIPSTAHARSPCANEHTVVSSQTIEPIRAALHCLTNEQRTQRGLAALNRDARLDEAAQGHSADMAARGYFSHTTPEGRSVADRTSAAGYESGYVGENIYHGPPTARRVIAGWMESLGHCRNILGSYADLGVGLVAEPQPYWTQNFGSSVAQPSDQQAGCPYIIDTDADGTKDLADNCMDLPNPDQRNLDEDELGDLCDPDRDGDQKPNDADLYPDEDDRVRPPVELPQGRTVDIGTVVPIAIRAAPSSRLTVSAASIGDPAVAVFPGAGRPADDGLASFPLAPLRIAKTVRISASDGVSTATQTVTARAVVVLTRARLRGRTISVRGRIRPAAARVRLAVLTSRFTSRKVITATNGAFSTKLRLRRAPRRAKLRASLARTADYRGDSATRKIARR